MKRRLLLACLLTLSCAQESCAKGGGEILAIARSETQAPSTLAVDSADFAPGAAIPLRFSAYGDNVSPGLTWRGLPSGTTSLALMMEDPDAMSARPFVHWLAWNLDLSAGLPQGALPAGAVQGRNSRGTSAYFGPRPHGKKPHHYHFQLFALDRRLDLPAGANREALLAAMKGHVVAKGELVGLFAQPRN